LPIAIILVTSTNILQGRTHNRQATARPAARNMTLLRQVTGPDEPPTTTGHEFPQPTENETVSRIQRAADKRTSARWSWSVSSWPGGICAPATAA
jgi:hypothetical protein